MSGRREKALRRASGLDSAALRGQREFEADVARVRKRQQDQARVVRAAEFFDALLPAPRRDGRRRALAVVALVIFVALLIAFARGAR